MKLDGVFSKLLTGKNLSLQESRNLFTELFKEKISQLEDKSVLLLLAKKGESVEEILGCLQALRALEPTVKTRIPDLIDTCGTGGDQSHSINVSTLAAFVIAGAGGKVAKHGNRGISSKCGSSDLMEALGVNLKQNASQTARSIQKNGIGYFHAPYHHPVFLKIQPLRKSLKTKTIFNLLGPLLNPLAPRYQMIGVPDSKTFDLYVALLAKLKTNALVCQGLDGLDEISLSAPTKVAILQNGRIRLGLIKPENFGFKKSKKLDVKGGSPHENARTALKILNGTLRGPVRDIVILNAGAGLVLCGIANSLTDGIHKAKRSLDSGRAAQSLRGLVKDSK